MSATVSTSSGDTGNIRKNNKVPGPFILFLFGSIFLASSFAVLNHYGLLSISDPVLLASRLLAIIAITGYALYKKSLTTWILISMVLGAEFGHDLPHIAVKMQVISMIFLRMIKTIIAPLLFATLVVGIAGHSNLKQVGRMGWKSLVYFEIVSTLALFIGLLAINISKAGIGVKVPDAINQAEMPAATVTKGTDLILHVFPENLAKAIYEGQVLQIVVFSIIFGIAVAMIRDKYKAPMIKFTEALAETMFKFTQLIMYFAPFAVFAAIAYS
ncbi:cation:dicarboxylase symporter family transporter, partial [bacterium]|nr:cation:dicarboxylase symporter family transporter [bacterium]